MNHRLLVALCVLLFLASRASADRENAQLFAVVGDETLALPMLRADFQVGVRGDLASVVLTQVFENPYDTPIHARYIFPLPASAAVHAMRLISGDEMIEAEIRTKPEARKTFEKAKTEGRQAALLNQERPNVFTQEVANLMPGAPIRVELEYAHIVPKQDGAYKLHVPTVVGPRFLPGRAKSEEELLDTRPEPPQLEIGVWNLPASPPVASPQTVDHERIAVRVDIDAGVAIRTLTSPSHPIVSEERSAAHRVVELAEGRVLDDRDFELHYALGGPQISAGLTTYAKDGDGFVSLLIEPPKDAAADAITAREMVFVLDCSGSMAGIPLAASKRFMRRTLREMRPGDSFRIIRFSDRATEWTEAPMPATPENLARGEQYVNALRGGGGTHMASGIRRALAPPVAERSLRIVVFLTDGYIGNDIDIVRLLESQRGDARLFSFGIGNSVNRYLIEEMGRVGRGASRVVRPNEDAERAADELVMRLAAPVLTDIEVDWGDAVVREVYPSAVPDLFLGQTVRILGRYDRGATTRAVVHGKIAGEPVSLPLDIVLPDRNDEIAGEALPIVWARAQVKDRMTRYLRPDIDDGERTRLKAEVTELGLAHRLITQWTAFVAVSKRVINPEGAGWPVDVAVSQVKGVPDTAYPPGALPKHASLHAARGSSLKAPGFGGGFDAFSGPEPSTWLALLGIALTAALCYRKRLSVTLRN